MTNWWDIIQPGDRVECIDPSGSEKRLILGKIYIIKSKHPTIDEFFILKEDENYPNSNWVINRFRPAYIKEFSNKLEKLVDE